MPRTVPIDAKAVAEAIDARLDELEWEPVDLQEVADVSGTTIQKLRNGSQDRYQPKILRAVAGALGFEDRDAFIHVRQGDPLPPRTVPPAERDSLRASEAALTENREFRRYVAMMEELMRRVEALERERG